MRIAGSNRYLLNPSEKETLDRMAKDGTLVDDVEEGEISDGSVEEITEEDFKQDGRSTRSRVWMGDLMNFPVSGNYSSNLYNFAWARAVQNKPLVDFDLDLKPMKDSRNTVKEEPCDVIIEDSSDESSSRMEKEEGELEEGEIELGSEMVAGEKSDLSSDKQDKESEEIDLDSRVSLILEELETVTEEAETSFEGACSRLQKSLESLKLMVSEDRVPVVDALVQQAFMGIQKVDSVYTSGNLMQKEQNKDPFSRLLTHIKNQFVVLFTTEQMKEIESMVDSMISEAVGKEEKEVHIGSGANMNCSANLAEKPDTSLISLEKPCLEPRSVASVGCSIGKTGLANLESLIIPRSRVEFSPLLDLHADHDEGSLPSPTRENAPPLPIWKPIGIGEVAVTPNQSMTSKNVKSEEATLHPYVTDALKAVSTYQQKYARTTFLQSSRLPSPTPSEECNDDDGDPHGEVSSSSAAGDVRSINSSVPLQLVGSSSGAFEDSSSGHLLAPASTVGQLGLGQLPVIKASAKSRDPRLRFVNSEVNGALDPNRRPNFVDSNAPKNGLIGGILTSRKHKAVDESVLDGHTLKRQRNGFANLRDVQVTSGRGGWLEESSRVASQLSDRIQLNENVLVETRKLVNGVVTSGERLDANTKFNGANSVVEQIPVASTATAVSLPSLLKDIAVNPTMLMNLIKMEQQRLAAESQQKNGDSASDKTQLSGVSKLPGGVSLVNGASRKTSELAQKPAGNPQMPPQTASMNSQNDMGRVRMKPRDPRRILHNNMVQKNESSGPEQTKLNGTISSDTQSNKEYLTVREQGEQAQTPGLASQSTPPPDITGQFTKKLKNLADILSGSQVTGTTPAVPPNISQPIPSKTNKMDVRPAMTDLNDQKFASGMTCEGGTTGASQLPNPWGDLDHLLDGYDDQQKAAIQRERARRIDEQNKMFAARKLCLVLDLDHTLLNSAKFLEVDQVHDEILRNKEEQDREKPQRHLFRFHHMGMWTKLRPGIWNFLEKASKLYELHLYTMGNKLYATEMAKVLDPTGALFAGRVLSRGDDNDPFDGDERVPKSKDLEGVLGMESAVVIIDDSVRVWPHNKLNLIVVERYTYFPCSRRQFGLLGPSLLEIDHDERPEDGTLASCLTVIERIHSNFFSHRSLNDVDVRNILASEQRNILSGCRIVFSRVFPVGEANPHMHPLWQTAEQFGAACTNQIDDQVTHVVANSRGTDKVNWALSTGRFVVHPGWVEASALLYRRANEHDFAVKL